MKRCGFPWLEAVLSLLSLLIASPLYAQTAPQPSVARSPDAVRPSSRVPTGYGIVIHQGTFSPAEYKLFRNSALRFIRDDFSWKDIEKTPGVYDFENRDKQLAQLETMGVRPLWILDYGNPLYGKGLPPYTPEGITAYARFAGAAAAHFRGRGVLWEIWNEPNEDNFWAGRPNADQYAALVKATVPALRAADPDAIILAGSISQINIPYITRFLQAHPLDGVTAFSIHPYCNGPPESAISDYAQVRSLLAQHTPPGQKPLPIVCSEWGYTTADGQTSEADQARYLVRMYLTNLLSGVTLTIAYDWANDGLDSANNENRYGILRQDRSPKPAYTALSEFLRRMSGYTFRHSIRGKRPSDYQLLFQGSGGLALVTWTSDAEATATAQTPRITRVGTGDAGYAKLLKIARLQTSPDDLPYPDVLPPIPGIVTVLTSVSPPARGSQPPKKTNASANRPDFSELLTNPGFEDGSAGWVSHTIEPRKRLGITRAVTHSGDRGAFMSAEPGTAPTWFSWSQLVTPVTPGQQYTFTGWVKMEDTRGPSGWFIHVNGANGAMPLIRDLTTPAGYSDWQRVSTTFTIPPNGTSITVGTLLYGSGNAYFDDASLVKQP